MVRNSHSENKTMLFQYRRKREGGRKGSMGCLVTYPDFPCTIRANFRTLQHILCLILIQVAIPTLLMYAWRKRVDEMRGI